MLVADFEVARRAFPVRLAIQAEAGERLAILGPSGAGKTTCLEALAGLLPLSAGQISLDGRQLSRAADPGSDVRAGHRGVGLLRQRPGLFPHLTVLENICYPPGASPVLARQTAARMGLAGLLDVRPRGLSGGEAQRVALCRTLQTGASLLCLDEPFTSLDPALGLELLELVRQELAEVSAFLVTHQLREAQAFANRVILLGRGQVLQVAGPRELVLRPNSARVAEMVGYRGFLRRGSQLVAIHPERVHAVDRPAGGVGISARVVKVRPEGGRIDAEMEAAGEWTGRFHCRLDEAPELGSTLLLWADDPPQFSGAEAVLD
ncbi:MAG: ATP-binding cassette domain-containing protein [Candidatus Dormiibacterota bacterium]